MSNAISTGSQNDIRSYFNEIMSTLNQMDVRPVGAAIDLLHQTRLAGRQVFILGNGGSASTASHMACDLAKNTRHANLPPFRVIGLTDNMALFSAYSNDEGYENAFAQQLASLVQPQDVVVAISTSGNSANVLRAVELAHAREAVTIGMTGFSGGRLGPMVNIHLHVPCDCIEQVEDIHLMLEHLMAVALREKIGVE
jgi:D-sedoheptulose 7-phosphate isomerase